MEREVIQTDSAPSAAEARSHFSLKTIAVITVAALVVRLIINLTAYRQFTDDAFIFMRYVDNAAAGHGLVFNPGERVIGFTSTLFVLLLSGLKMLLPFVRTETLFAVFDYVATAAAIWLTLSVFRENRFRWMIAAFFVLYYPFIDGSLNGMETSLMLTCIAGCFYALQRERWQWAITIAALSLLTRPEGAFLLFSTFAYVFALQKKGKLAYLVPAVVLLGGWALIAKSYYGTFIPQSMLSKSSTYAGEAWAGDPSTPITKYMVLSQGVPQGALSSSGASQIVISFVAFMLLPLFALGLVQGYRQRNIGFVAGVFFLLVLAFYIVGKPVTIASWHVIPPAFAFFATIFVGLQALRREKLTWLPAAAAVGVTVVCVGSVLLGLKRRVDTMERFGSRYESLAAELKTRVPNAQSVLVGDIGVIGYRTGWKVIDTAGLVTPEVLKPGPDGSRKSLGKLIEADKPDIICVKTDILSTPAVNESWIAYKTFPTDSERQQFIADYEEVPELQPLYGRTYVRRSLISRSGS